MKKQMDIEIGKRLRQKREACGYSREKLAELCGLSARFLANIELGDAGCSVESLRSLCKALSCSSDFLLFGAERETSAWAGVCEKLSALDPVYAQPVEKLIDGLREAILQAEK